MKHPIRILIGVMLVALAGVVAYSFVHDDRYVRIDNRLDSRPDDAMTVVFVGNSHTYTNALPQMVQALVPDEHPPLWFHTSTSPGKMLNWHVQEGEALEVLSEESWDVVVMQPGSTEPLGRPSSMITNARRMGAAARPARPIVFMPWARHPRYGAELYRARWYAPNYEVAVDGIAKNTAAIGVDVAPVGVAWKLAMEQTDVELYRKDGNHATRAGSFLAALVLYSVIYEADPTVTNWSPPGITAEDADTLRRVAAAAVKSDD